MSNHCVSTFASRIGVLVALSCVGAAQADDTAPFAVRVLAPITAAMVDGECTLRYELIVTNRHRAARRIDAIRVLADGRDPPIATLAGKSLTEHLVAPGTTTPIEATLAPGASATVFFDHPCAERPTATLQHRIEAAGAPDTLGAAIPIAAPATLLLGPPLRGGPWAAVASAAWPRGHRRVCYTVDGITRLPGRYAIDFVRVDSRGHIANGDADTPANALGYGADVLAVADASVAAARDGMAESASVDANPHHAAEDAAGNFIALALPDGRFAVYEHLRPGSVRVLPGQHVSRGDVIGQLGFTGDSTGPHLHFHLADAAAPLAGEGLPYGLDRFTRLGAYPDIGKLGTSPWESQAATQSRHGELPASNTVIQFDTGAPSTR